MTALRRRAAIAGLALALLAGAAAAFVPGAKGRAMTEDPIVAFARDFSGNDADIVARAAGFVADPPSDRETIGFYSMDRDPPRRRAFLATVSLLADRGKLDSVEDKYSYEIFDRWRDAGAIDADALPPAAKAVFGPILNGTAGEESADGAAYRARVWRDYAKATGELEAHMAARGRVLLSIDATDGDTMFFALVPPAIADRWRDKALAESGVHRSGVRAPMWDRFWHHLTYAMRGMIADETREGVPPGTRVRDDAIPFAT